MNAIVRASRFNRSIKRAKRKPFNLIEAHKLVAFDVELCAKYGIATE